MREYDFEERVERRKRAPISVQKNPLVGSIAREFAVQSRWDPIGGRLYVVS